MAITILQDNTLEKTILHSLKSNAINNRLEKSSGLWLGPLAGLSALITILQEDSSYSEICLLVGLTGFGLIISTVCLLNQLLKSKTNIKDFQVVYFLPAIITSTLFRLVANKGLLVSSIWGLSAGTLSTWGVLQTMSYFPGCFTLGEATVVTHGAVLFLISTFTNLPLRYHLPPIHSNDIATVILQIGGLFVLSMCLLCAVFPKLREAQNFYLAVLGTLLLAAVPVLHILLDQSPLLWILSFVFSNKVRIILVIYWSLCLLLATLVLIFQITSNSRATTAARKYFHVLAVVVYIPGLLYDPTLLYFASGAVMILFIFLELMRILKIPPLGEFLQQGFSVFADEKDNLVSLTPLYLLSGLSFPIWAPTNGLGLLPLLSGVLTVGIGDTAASYFGNKYGKHKWPGSSKSVEGTVACIISQLLVIYGLTLLGFVEGFWILVKATFAVVGVSLVEAKTDQVDNLVLPLLMYVCLVFQI